MDGVGFKEAGIKSETFDFLSFERKLAELVEELRMNRNLEKENEKNLESVLDEKYKAEISFDEQKMSLFREKNQLQQQIDILKRKLEDRFCVSDDKEKGQIMSKIYSHEIRVLKEELRATKTEVLMLQKTVQEVEGKLNLDKKFQIRIMSQVSEVQAMTKCIAQEFQGLRNSQSNVLENLSRTRELLLKYNTGNQNLQNALSLAKRKIHVMKKELVAQKSEMVFIKSSMGEQRDKNPHSHESQKLHQKLLEMDQLLLLSRKEHGETLRNFLESNKLLAQFMDRYTDLQAKEKSAIAELDLTRRRLAAAAVDLKTSHCELKKLRDEMARKTAASASMQAEEIICDKNQPQQMIMEDFVEAARNDLAALQENVVILKSEILIKEPMAEAASTQVANAT